MKILFLGDIVGDSGCIAVKKHLKTTKEKKGGIISKENFINLSNLTIMIETNKNKKKEVKK